MTEERRGRAREQGAPAPSRPPLPRQLTLPSGRRVKLSERAITDAAARSSRPVASPLSAAWSALAAPAALVDDTGPVTVGDLPLSDAHVLAALVFRAGLVDEPRVDVRCDNCDRAFSVQPSSAVEPGPFVDDELSDPELDAPFDFDRNLDVPPIFTPSGRAALPSGSRASESSSRDEVPSVASCSGDSPSRRTRRSMSNSRLRTKSLRRLRSIIALSSDLSLIHI